MSNAIPVELARLLEERVWLQDLARVLVRYDHAADEVVQDTWVSTLHRAITLDAPRAWLATVARNHARLRVRARRRRVMHETAAARPEAITDATPDEVVARFETGRRVAEAVHALDEPFRTTLLLHWFDGLQLAEIARRTGVPAGTVRWRLHRGHALLRARLESTLGRDWRRAILPLCTGLRFGLSGALLPLALLLIASALGWFAVHLAIDGDGIPLAASHGSIGPTRDVGARDDRAASTNRDLRRNAAGTDDPIPVAPSTTPPHGASVSLRLRVVDRATQPIAGATVSVDSAANGSTRFSGEALAACAPAVRSRADGSAEVRIEVAAAAVAQLQRGRSDIDNRPWSLDLVVEAKRCVRSTRRVHVVDGDRLDLGDFVLDGTGSLTGRIVDARGRPVDGAQIGLVRPPIIGTARELLAGDRIATQYVVTSSEHGAFRVEAAALGPALVLVASPGVGGASRPIRVEPGIQDPGELTLTPSPLPVADEFATKTTRVTVLDATRRPLPSAPVFHRAANGWGMSRTHRDGVATVDLTTIGNEPGDFEVFAADDDGALEPSAPQRVIAGTAEIEIVLRPARTSLVRVHAEDPGALGRAWVGWRMDGKAAFTGGARKVGDARFELPIPPFPAELVVRADGYAPVVEPVRVPAAWPTSIDVTLRRLHRIHGVVRAGDRTVPDATITVVVPGTVSLRDGFRSSYGDRVGETSSDADGRFVFDRLERGRLALLVHAAGFAPTLADLGDFDPGREQDEVTIALTSGVIVSGILRGSDGAPRPRGLVALNSDRVRAVTAITDRDGRFRFEHVAPGTYELRPTTREIDPSGWQTITMAHDVLGDGTWSNLRVGDRDVEQDVVTDLCTLTGHLDNRLGSLDFRGWTATLGLPHDDRPLGDPASLDASGNFALVSFAGGEHRLRIRAPGGAFGDLEITATVVLAPGTNRLGRSFELVPAAGELPAIAGPGSAELRGRREGWEFRVRLDLDPRTRGWTTALAPVGTLALWQADREIATVEIDRR